MRSSLLLDRGERTFVIVFDKDDEVIEGLTDFASRQRLRASHVTAIGARRLTPAAPLDRRHGATPGGSPASSGRGAVPAQSLRASTFAIDSGLNPSWSSATPSLKCSRYRATRPPSSSNTLMPRNRTRRPALRGMASDTT